MKHPDKQTAAPPGYAWEGEQHQLVPVVSPTYPDAESEADAAPEDGLERLRLALIAVIGIPGKHRDGSTLRAAALGVLTGLYANSSQAAKHLEVSVSTVTRAIAEVRRDLAYAKNHPKPPIDE
jgi:hypothetical protein